MNPKDSARVFETEIGGRKLTIETGRLAKQATGSCTVQYGDTVILATVVMAKEAQFDKDFFPLTVEYEERLYAAGKIKGSRFVKREGRPSDDAVLVGRFIDRGLRPLFPSGLKNEVQIIVTVLSVDQENSPEVISIIGASAALAISGIPWNGPVGGIRLGRIGGEWVVNPSYDATAKSDLDLVLTGTGEKIMMIEGAGHEVGEEVIEEAVKLGLKHLGKITALINEVKQAIGKPTIKVEVEEEFAQSAQGGSGGEDSDPPAGGEAEKEKIKKMGQEFLASRLNETLFGGSKETKADRKHALEKLEGDLELYLKEQQVGKDKRKYALADFYDLANDEVIKGILKEDKRVDGRKLNEIRSLSCEAGVLPRTHGSGLFNRGETQVLSTVTLAGPSSEQIVEGLEPETKKRYMHHYYFPPYSVGEVKKTMVGRREIGHGALAEKALMPVLPSKEEFPYTIRVVSEVLGSNGSSSMAATCGSTLALMDAGVPIKRPVAGIAIGLASDGKGDYKIITDLQDLEDGQGGMDFKVTRTEKGITAIQMDTKTEGLTFEIIKDALAAGQKAIMQILDCLKEVLPEPRKELSPYSPRIECFKIDPDKIREVIGAGGKVINEIIAKTGTEIDIANDGSVTVCAFNGGSMEKAVEWIKNIVKVPEVGEVYNGTVTRIMNFGAFVEILPGKEGMVHISELASHRVDRVEDVVNIGDAVTVKVIEIDEMGRTNLSLKRAQPGWQDNRSDSSNDDSFGSSDRPRGRLFPPRRSGPPRGGSRDRGGRGFGRR
ncbi:MAG: polyribonucleotide nucleotidyltransferase [bacterium]